MRRQVRRIIAVSLQERVFAASNPRTRRETERTYKAAGSPQNPNTSKCKRNASDVVFTTKGSRRVLVCKRTRRKAARSNLSRNVEALIPELFRTVATESSNHRSALLSG